MRRLHPEEQTLKGIRRVDDESVTINLNMNGIMIKFPIF